MYVAMSFHHCTRPSLRGDLGDIASESMTTVPRSVWIIYWILFSIEVFAYAVGWAISEPAGRKKRAAELNSGSMKEAPNGTGDHTGLVA